MLTYYMEGSSTNENINGDCIMKTLTVKKSISECGRLWTGLSKTRKQLMPNDLKEFMIKKLGMPNYRKSCPACEYVKQQYGSCADHCPMLKVWGARCEVSCAISYSPYLGWRYAVAEGRWVQARKYAKQIAQGCEELLSCG